MNCKHNMPVGLCAVCATERNRREYAALAEITGRTIADLEAELTAPDEPAECRHGLDPYDCTICSYEGWGTWSTQCRHGQHIDTCWECNSIGPVVNVQ